MKVGKHVWYLKAACPDCGQGSALVFVVCPACAHLALHCDELTTPVFPNPRDLTNAVDPSAPCPSCSKHPIEKFDLATSEAIRRAGFAREQYST